ncbi:MurR/RpiR family transcriptional regulator [Paracoccaceae bacterium Fryx2]|nr:MurR/RpiR family transcriptional regulator [Paracoccaceae bacterium Fryx2]
MAESADKPAMTAPAKPATAAEFQTLLVQGRDRFTPRMLEAGAYVVENPKEVAFSAVAVLAQQSGIASTSFVRLAQAMGFSGFSEMQALFREPLRRVYPSSLEERIRHSQGEQVIPDPSDVAAIGRSFAQANIASLTHLADRLAAMPLEAAIDLVLGARIVHVIGVDRSFAVASYLSYALNRAGLQSFQITGLGSAIADHGALMAPDDLLIAISFPPYAAETVAITRQVHARGNPVLAITNSTVSPITEGARQVLFVNDAELHGFRSLTALMSLVQTLMMGIAFRKRHEAAGFDIDEINA